MKEVKLFSSNDNILISQVEEILKQENIPYVKKIKGAGSYLNIAYGSTIEETEIIINEENLERANNLIETFSIEDKDPTLEDKQADDEIQEDIKKYKAFRRWVILVFCFFFPLIVLIIAKIGEFINNRA